MDIKRGQIWEKITEQWQGNAPKGTLVKVTGFIGPFNFIKHRYIKKVLIFNVCFGDTMCLSPTAFKMIFGRVE